MPCMTDVRDRSSKSNRILIAVFGVLAVAGIVIAGLARLAEGDQRVLVVTMEQGVTDADRATLKDECGSLPGIGVVADQGAQEAQYRFPVRFDIAGSSQAQEAALEACIARFPQTVRGLLIEGGDT
jgi:hypothetical protein